MTNPSRPDLDTNFNSVVSTRTVMLMARQALDLASVIANRTPTRAHIPIYEKDQVHPGTCLPIESIQHLVDLGRKMQEIAKLINAPEPGQAYGYRVIEDGLDFVNRWLEANPEPAPVLPAEAEPKGTDDQRGRWNWPKSE